MSTIENKINHSFERLKKYCETNNFIGYDPYDGLNSEFLENLGTFSKNKLFKLIWIQFFKKFPFNLRKLFKIKPDYNPKALALFLSAYCKLYKSKNDLQYLNKINFFINKIINLQTKGFSGACWGYNFDWQSRAFFQPKYTPTIVVSSFVANALLDAYEITADERLLKLSRSTCDFILLDLNRHVENDKSHAFSYSPFDKSIVFNASLLGARLLSRVYYYTREEILFIEAKKSINYVCDNQNSNGSWSYGKYSFHKWIDNFHTGYNLECIADYIKYTKDTKYESNLTNGFKYYINTFFLNNGQCKYYNNKLYPIDIHSISQLVITLDKLKKLKEYKGIIDNVLSWTITNMQHESGFFYYQKNRFYTIRIPYMRWSQAWMFLALSTYLKKFNPVHTLILNDENLV
jgi:hypothetical protein